MNTTENNIIDTLNARITDELTAIDREEVYRVMLNEYNAPIHVAGLTFMPSRIIEQLDPTAFRCGVNDYFGTDDRYVEVGSETYEQDECKKIKEKMVDELEGRALELEAEIGDEERDGAPEHQEELAEVNESLRLLARHSF